MILTTNEKLDTYCALNPHFEKAFAALKAMAQGEFVRGKHPVDGENVFINALEYDTHPAEGARMEAHRAYIDVMWMVAGEETIGVCPVEQMTEVIKDYDPAGDAMLAKLPAGCTCVQMKKGSVCILLPEDGHAPGMDAEGKSHVQKLIAKVRVD